MELEKGNIVILILFLAYSTPTDPSTLRDQRTVTMSGAFRRSGVLCNVNTRRVVLVYSDWFGDTHIEFAEKLLQPNEFLDS